MLKFIVSEFLPSSIHSSCWMQDAKSGQNILLSKVCSDWGASLDCMFITNLRLELSSIHFFFFSHMFIHISIFTNPKNDISTIDQGFPISERSLEALFQFISSPCSFSSFHRSFPLSISKNIKNYLLISIS